MRWLEESAATSESNASNNRAIAPTSVAMGGFVG